MAEANNWWDDLYTSPGLFGLSGEDVFTSPLVGGALGWGLGGGLWGGLLGAGASSLAGSVGQANVAAGEREDTFEDYVLTNYGPSLYNVFFKDFTQKFLNLLKWMLLKKIY